MEPNFDCQFSAYCTEREFLCKFIRDCPGRYAIEIGCFRGTTTRTLAQVCQDVGKVLVGIDPWNNSQDGADGQTYQYFMSVVEPYVKSGSLIVVRGESQTVALPPGVEGNCAMAFVDGRHHYPYCYQDMVRYYEVISPGGVLVMHDLFDFWKPHTQRGFNEFIGGLPRPVSVYHYVYYPTEEEVSRHGFGKAGLTYLYKE